MLCYNSFADKKGKIYFLLILKEYLYKYTFSKLVCISYKNIFMKETDHAGTNLVFLMLQENKSRGISGSIKKTKTTYLISKNKGNYHKIYNPFFLEMIIIIIYIYKMCFKKFIKIRKYRISSCFFFLKHSSNYFNIFLLLTKKAFLKLKKNTLQTLKISFFIKS